MVDRLTRIALDREPDEQKLSFSSIDDTVNDIASTTLWGGEGDIVYLTEDTQMYMSSTSPLDDCVILAIGITIEGEFSTTIATLDGNNQVPLIGDIFFLVVDTVPLSGPILGEIYISTDAGGAMTDGIPDDSTKVQGVITGPKTIQGDLRDSGTPFAVTGSVNNGFALVPKGFKLLIYTVIVSTSNDAEVTITLWKKPESEEWVSDVTIISCANAIPVRFVPPLSYNQLTQIEIRAVTDKKPAKVATNVYGTIVRNVSPEGQEL